MRILHLEDNEMDAELIEAALKSQGVKCVVDRVDSGADFQRALRSASYDLILSDFSMPGFDGAGALKVAKALKPEVPFVFVSGTIGEERAVESLKNGAVDYVLKDRLQRLGSAVNRARRDAEAKADQIKMEREMRRRNDLFQQITEHVDDLIAIVHMDGEVVFISPSYLMEMNREIMTAHNYRVFAAPHGAAALTCLEENKSQIEAVVIDISTSGANGVKFIDALKDISPGALIFGLSAGGVDCFMEQEKRGLIMLRKPCSTPDLLAALKRELQAQGVGKDSSL